MDRGEVFDSSALQEGVFTVQADPAEAVLARQRLQASVSRRHKARQHARFVAAEDRLAALLPATFDADDTWHVLSSGDIDALSYVKHIRAGEPFSAVILACWAISRPAIEYLQAEFDAGRLCRVDAYVGDIMPRDRPDLHHMLCSLVAATGGRVIAFKNHAKAWLFLSDAGRAVVMETSANPNYNRRVEQTVISASPEVADVYKRWFDALDLPAPTFADWKPHAWPPAKADSATRH